MSSTQMQRHGGSRQKAFSSARRVEHQAKAAAAEDEAGVPPRGDVAVAARRPRRSEIGCGPALNCQLLQGCRLNT